MKRILAAGLAGAAMLTGAGCVGGAQSLPPVVRCDWPCTGPIDVQAGQRLDIVLNEPWAWSNDQVDEFVDECYRYGGDVRNALGQGYSVCVGVDF